MKLFSEAIIQKICKIVTEVPVLKAFAFVVKNACFRSTTMIFLKIPLDMLTDSICWNNKLDYRTEN